jgi:hypothetical protein
MNLYKLLNVQKYGRVVGTSNERVFRTHTIYKPISCFNFHGHTRS